MYCLRQIRTRKRVRRRKEERTRTTRLQHHGPLSNQLGPPGEPIVPTLLISDTKHIAQKYDSFDTSATYPLHNRGHAQSSSNGAMQHTQYVLLGRF